MRVYSGTRWATAARTVTVTGVPAGLCALLGAEAAAQARRLWHERDLLAFDDLVLVCALAVLAGTAGWLALAVALTAATGLLRCTHTAAGRIAHRLTPALCRGLLGGACGAVLLGAGPPASAGIAALPLPDRPVDLRLPVAGTCASVRVRVGDTLWAVAARHLSPTAADARVARAWPVWFRRNRGAIGPDPHLIHPGTRLTVPPRFR